MIRAGKYFFTVLKYEKTSLIIESKNRTFSSTVKPFASYEDLQAATKSKESFIIDVREPQELQETGVIPSSINIPLGEVESALKLPAERFREKYGKEKPREGTLLIFSCKLGKRSETAQDIALKLGYKNAKNFLGGWLEWEEKLTKK